MRFKCLDYKASCATFASRVLVVFQWLCSLISPTPNLAMLGFKSKTDLYLICTCYNAGVKGIDPVLKPQSGSHLQLSLQLPKFCTSQTEASITCSHSLCHFNVLKIKCSLSTVFPPSNQFHTFSVYEVAVNLIIFTTQLNFVSPVNVTGSNSYVLGFF